MSASFTDRARVGGFTLVELVMVMVLIGILSVVILPRLNSTSGFTSALFRDELASTLRYAQKAATSRRRMVCASIAPGAVGLSVATVSGATACDQGLQLAGGGSTLVSKDAAVTISPAPVTLYFQPDGRITADGNGANIYNASLSVSGEQLDIIGATGHVR